MSIVNHDQDRLIHVIAFFLGNTKHCFKMKLFKLLFFADIEHFQQTGKPITNLEYFAWPMGPVPVELNNQIKSLDTALTKKIKIVAQKYVDPEVDGNAVIMSPTIKFDYSLFSPREVKILKQIAEIYFDVKSNDISQISHDKNGPWYRVYVTEKKKQHLIPLVYSLDDTKRAKASKEQAEEIEENNKEMKRMFG